MEKVFNHIPDNTWAEVKKANWDAIVDIEPIPLEWDEARIVEEIQKGIQVIKKVAKDCPNTRIYVGLRVYIQL